ncbi:MAG TPA: hypothetical protein P5026_14890 [Kiritimatiellia bacterium]|nr:hypothetical protein [Kiritimatiellia bacterium]HRU71312.1 hypothetical protein [Kiritimatiellia bacterium]
MSRLDRDTMTTFKRFQTPFILAMFLLLTASGFMTGWTDRLIAPLTQHNLAFLDVSIKDTFHLMIPVGAAKAAADIVEGSTVNIEAGAVFAKAGMTIEAGDTLQPLLDYIEVAWHLLLASMIYLVTAKCVVSGATATAGPLLIFALGVFLLNSIIALFAAGRDTLHQVLHRLGAIFLLCALLFQVIIPLTVAGSAYLAHHTTAPMRASVSASFQKIGKVFSMERFHATDDLKEKAVVLKDKLSELSLYAKDAISDVAFAVCTLAAIKLLMVWSFRSLHSDS